jgi:hypothetical protein
VIDVRDDTKVSNVFHAAGVYQIRLLEKSLVLW